MWFVKKNEKRRQNCFITWKHRRCQYLIEKMVESSDVKKKNYKNAQALPALISSFSLVSSRSFPVHLLSSDCVFYFYMFFLYKTIFFLHWPTLSTLVLDLSRDMMTTFATAKDRDLLAVMLLIFLSLLIITQRGEQAWRSWEKVRPSGNLIWNMNETIRSTDCLLVHSYRCLFDWFFRYTWKL